jgi:hypothetical protein
MFLKYFRPHLFGPIVVNFAGLGSINLAIDIVPIRLISCLTADSLKCEPPYNGLKLY